MVNDMTTQISVPEIFVAKARGVEVKFNPQDLPEASLSRVLAYGLQRILNDACAGAKSDEEAEELANKKLDNLMNGVLRAAGTREGDPIKAEAMRMALNIVRAAPKYRAWIATNGLKLGDKDAVAKAKELAAGLATREDIVAKAKASVLATKDIEIELDL